MTVVADVTHSEDEPPAKKIAHYQHKCGPKIKIQLSFVHCTLGCNMCNCNTMLVALTPR